jgi:hypothetical protein
MHGLRSGLRSKLFPNGWMTAEIDYDGVELIFEPVPPCNVQELDPFSMPSFCKAFDIAVGCILTKCDSVSIRSDYC